MNDHTFWLLIYIAFVAGGITGGAFLAWHKHRRKP